MVPIRHAVGNSIHNVFTTRIVPKYSNRQATGSTDGKTDAGTAATAASGAATSTSTPSTGPTADASGVVSGTGSSATTVPTADATDPAADFKALFGHASQAGTSQSATSSTPSAPANPTVASVFGPNPYLTNVGGSGPNGITYGYNPIYFATKATADKLAQMYGGTVIEMNAITPYGPFSQNQPNEMIQFSNGAIVNAGNLAAYYDRGWSQEKVDQAIQNEINGIPS